jgi:hypothetical protein
MSAPAAPKVRAITVERVGESIRARAWAESGIARYWQPLEDETFTTGDALTRWMSSLDTRYGPQTALLVSPELRADVALMDAIKRGMRVG